MKQSLHPRVFFKTLTPPVSWQILAAMLFSLQVTTSFADIAILREKGPWSGSVFSTPGVLAGHASDLKVSMTSADVKIHLRRGEGDQLAADCQADFVLDDQSDSSTTVREFLVAFPVTGLSSKVVSVGKFVVTVNGERPATVLRQTIAISRREYETKDSAIYGKLDAKFDPHDSRERFSPPGVIMASNRVYPDAYVWVQKSTAGSKTSVHISYTVSIRPQTIHYSKSYTESPNDSEVIPFDDLAVDEWDKPYYLFDYVLLSGSTWDGPIGSEKIELSADPASNIDLGRVLSRPRHPLGYPRSRDELDSSVGFEETFERTGLQWRFEGKPGSDLLLAIPASAMGPDGKVLKK